MGRVCVHVCDERLREIARERQREREREREREKESEREQHPHFVALLSLLFRTHTHTHARTHTRTHIDTYRHISTRIDTHRHASTRIDMRCRMSMHAIPRRHQCLLRYVCVCVCVCICVYFMLTRIDTHRHASTPTQTPRIDPNRIDALTRIDTHRQVLSVLACVDDDVFTLDSVSSQSLRSASKHTLSFFSLSLSLSFSHTHTGSTIRKLLPHNWKVAKHRPTFAPIHIDTHRHASTRIDTHRHAPTPTLIPALTPVLIPVLTSIEHASTRIDTHRHASTRIDMHQHTPHFRALSCSCVQAREFRPISTPIHPHVTERENGSLACLLACLRAYLLACSQRERGLNNW